MKLKWHKLTHWEYWPVYILYLPTFFLWVWWSIRFRSIHFYKWSNPSISNGGLFGDSKKEIYDLLPPSTYPKTLLIQKNGNHDFKALLESHGLAFPLIVKPNIGCRGVHVTQVKNFEQLKAYAEMINSDFLIQELVDFPSEIGLFYCRMPNDDRGRITGITIKNFLSVVGNGKDNLEQLIKKNPRFEMQLGRLRKEYNLRELLKENEKRCLVPYGNHNRGTEFLDGKAFITARLESTFNEILKQVDGFHYGRLDIRFNTFAELEQGEKFSILEINGAKSEPTHIYDPKHSLFFGLREIFRHQMIMKRIIEKNRSLNVKIK
jgi:hypothetical protein